MAIKQAIKQAISLLNRSIPQIPSNRRPPVINRVNAVLQKYNQNTNSETQLQSFLKQLQFNVNFIKLSYPQINLQEPKKQQPKKQQSQSQEQLFQIDKSQSQLKQGEKVKFVSSHIRNQVDFSNWNEGNTDPQLLRKHKELVQRQYYGGDYWRGKQIPKMQTKQFLEEIMSNVDQSKMKDHVVQIDHNRKKKQPRFTDDPMKRFQKVKR